MLYCCSDIFTILVLNSLVVYLATAKHRGGWHWYRKKDGRDSIATLGSSDSDSESESESVLPVPVLERGPTSVTA